MTDLIVVPHTGHWQRLKAMVLNSVSSPITKRVYNLGFDEYLRVVGQEYGLRSPENQGITYPIAGAERWLETMVFGEANNRYELR